MTYEQELKERIKKNIKINKNGCWIWQRPLDKYGYARFNVHSQNKKVHKISYQIYIGKIKKGLILDHFCKNRNCVNPKHLEQVTMYENTMRGDGPSAKAKRQNKCIKGHEYNDVNTRFIISKTGREQRVCRICHKTRMQKYRVRV